MEALLSRRPAIVYCMPNFQNPTGLSLDIESRRALAGACARTGALLIEDDYEAELSYEGATLPALSALPEGDEIAYVGTLSKSLCPGLRVGWVAGSPSLIDRLARVKRSAQKAPVASTSPHSSASPADTPSGTATSVESASGTRSSSACAPCKPSPFSTQPKS